MKVHYEFSRDGITGARNFSDVEVSEELGAVLMELDREEYNRNHTETRRHESYSNCNDKRDNLVDKSIDVEAETITNFDYKQLHKAIDQLLPQQQDLVKKVFVDGLSHTEIAKREGVARQAIEDRLNRILKKMKKLLN